MGERLRKWKQLSAREKLLFLQAACLLAGATLALHVLPFSFVRGYLLRRPAASSATGNQKRVAPERIAWLVTAASQFLPGATCLPRAIAAGHLLRREGYPADVHLGVSKAANGRFQAHAWVESEGQMVVGGTDELRSYSVLRALKEKHG